MWNKKSFPRNGSERRGGAMQWVVGPEMQVVWPRHDGKSGVKSWWETTVSAKLWMYSTGDEAKLTFSWVSLSIMSLNLGGWGDTWFFSQHVCVCVAVWVWNFQTISEQKLLFMHYSLEVWVGEIFFIFIQQASID